MAASKFKVEILEPDGRVTELAPGDVFSGYAAEIVFPGLDGFVGVRPGHAQMLAGVSVGDLLVVEDRDGNPRPLHFAISGGLLEVAEGGDVTVFADSIEFSGEIDLDRAEEALARAKKRLDEKDVDIRRAEAAIARALNRVDVARRYRGR